MKVTLFSLPGSVCQRCRMTKMHFDKLEIPYREVQIDKDVEAYNYVKQLGYDSAPIVEVEYGDGASWHWSGYRPDFIGLLVP